MKDHWLLAAFSDDNIVADLLLRLKDSPSSSPPPRHHHHHHLRCLPSSWGLRLPRSKPSSSSSLVSPPPQPPPHNIKKRGCDTRRSPTTPLSWTPSDGACDDSLSSHHLPPLSDRFRSKVSGTTETPTITTTATTSKRPRRKKTFGELKEEENSLLKERMYLKKELATLRQSVKEQRSINENLKRMKLDLHVETRVKSESNSVDERNNTSNGISEAASSSATRLDKIDDNSESDSQKQKATSQEHLFVLPDLNMVPEEDTNVGMS